MEKRTLKILYNKSGGNGGITNRITLPTSWINDMGFTLDKRKAEVIFDGEKIIIKKS